MTYPRKHQVGKQTPNEYATAEDFRLVFSEGVNDLYRLSFHLTRGHEKAKQCFDSAREDCGRANRVFKDWAHSWAKRAIIQNAIRALRPRPSNAGSSSFAVPPAVAMYRVAATGSSNLVPCWHLRTSNALFS